ncbi:NUDIX hydrolase [Streptomyces sp. M2CJ-2]|uniref:NUDIX hydrolase n=1 Tax=Streptomyces sp. M2CJ-2 TaxID=2803948 RepID=UPI001925CF2A|nr:NUDIX hydrolase [Streptomyces sp. M2CJ-2]MBL3668776.1 NUDIX hydrolase [Streptomyces sp. M2CJ-2]
MSPSDSSRRPTDPYPGPRPAAVTLTVQAAGCVLWRRSPVGGTLELCLVHRPKYDDWSWPKGKLKRGEDPLAGALREVAEETGHWAVPVVELPSAHYVANGRPKRVRYWAAEAVSGTFTPNDEVDRILWLPPHMARRRLTEPRDADLVDALLATFRPTR